MKKSIYVVAVLLLVLLIGFNKSRASYQPECSADHYSMENPVPAKQESVAQALITSKIMSGECYLCGRNERSLMSYYRKMNSVGVLFLNSWKMADVQAIALDDDGREIPCDGTSSTITDFFGEGEGMISIHSLQERGISHVEVQPAVNNTLNLDLAAEKLCQNCINQMVDGFEGETLDEMSQEPDMFLVDFSAVRIYPLEGGRNYMIGDYYMETECVEDGINILVVYAPEREIKKPIRMQ